MSSAAARFLWVIEARVVVAVMLALIVSVPLLHLPAASRQTGFGPGFIASVFGNIALTASARRQDGYDRRCLACAVGAGTVPAVKQ